MKYISEFASLYKPTHIIIKSDLWFQNKVSKGSRYEYMSHRLWTGSMQTLRQVLGVLIRRVARWQLQTTCRWTLCRYCERMFFTWSI